MSGLKTKLQEQTQEWGIIRKVPQSKRLLRCEKPRPKQGLRKREASRKRSHIWKKTQEGQKDQGQTAGIVSQKPTPPFEKSNSELDKKPESVYKQEVSGWTGVMSN